MPTNTTTAPKTERFQLRPGEAAKLMRATEQTGESVTFEMGTGRLLWTEGESEWPLKTLLAIRGVTA